MTTIQARRKLIVVLLLCVALGGAVIRNLSSPGTTARDVGTLLMLLWIPVIGNVVAWVIGKARRAKAADPAIASAAAAEAATAEADGADANAGPHVRVQFTLRPAGVPAEDIAIAEGEHQCAFVVGNEGFSATWFVPVGRSFYRGTAQTLDVRFAKPSLALKRLQPRVAFRMLVGESFIGDGVVLEVLPPTAGFGQQATTGPLSKP